MRTPLKTLHGNDDFHIQSQFPEFKLEDKLAPLAGGIDKEDVVSPKLIRSRTDSAH